MASPSTLGERLKQARVSRNISQEKLAIELGVSWSTINRYERDKNTPSINRLRLMSDVLEVPLSDLIGEAA